MVGLTEISLQAQDKLPLLTIHAYHASQQGVKQPNPPSSRPEVTSSKFRALFRKWRSEYTCWNAALMFAVNLVQRYCKLQVHMNQTGQHPQHCPQECMPLSVKQSSLICPAAEGRA